MPPGFVRVAIRASNRGRLIGSQASSGLAFPPTESLPQLTERVDAQAHDGSKIGDQSDRDEYGHGSETLVEPSLGHEKPLSVVRKDPDDGPHDHGGEQEPQDPSGKARRQLH